MLEVNAFLCWYKFRCFSWRVKFHPFKAITFHFTSKHFTLCPLLFYLAVVAFTLATECVLIDLIIIVDSFFFYLHLQIHINIYILQHHVSSCIGWTKMNWIREMSINLRKEEKTASSMRQSGKRKLSSRKFHSCCFF